MAPSASVREDAPFVLVVDDLCVNRRVAELALRRLGYRTAIADSGLAALEILTRLGSRMPSRENTRELE